MVFGGGVSGECDRIADYKNNKMEALCQKRIKASSSPYTCHADGSREHLKKITYRLEELGCLLSAV